MGFFEKDATKWDDHETYKIGMICGRKYDKSVNGGFCPEEWTHAVEIPNEPGTYKVGLSRHACVGGMPASVLSVVVSQRPHS